jgi:hypothetical protein
VLLPGLLAYAVSLWLGLYLLARSPRKAPVRRTAIGLLAYGLAIAAELLRGEAPGAPPARLASLLVVVPALCWSGALIALLPEELPRRAALDWLWARGLVPLSAALLAGAALAGAAVARALLTIAGALAALALAGAFALVIKAWRALRPAPLGGLLAVATLFFGQGCALLIIPLGWMPRPLAMAAIGLDLALLGLAVAIWDAFDEGESLRRDMLRSSIGASGAALLFGGQIAVAMLLLDQPAALLPLLLTSVGAAIATQTLSGALAGLGDRLALRAPAMERARAELRATAEALPRADGAVDPLALDEAEFARLTRRALSHYGDLPRLASSPLTRLPAIDARLAARGAPDQPLERAAELRVLLAESIERLRPRGESAFGTSDAWRHYNALYFPYVAGLRPYSSRANHGQLDPAGRQALDWLASAVPERTLYNWQNAAARLVAEDLRAGERAEAAGRG